MCEGYQQHVRDSSPLWAMTGTPHSLGNNPIQSEVSHHSGDLSSLSHRQNIRPFSYHSSWHVDGDLEIPTSCCFDMGSASADEKTWVAAWHVKSESVSFARTQLIARGVWTGVQIRPECQKVLLDTTMLLINYLKQLRRSSYLKDCSFHIVLYFTNIGFL